MISQTILAVGSGGVVGLLLGATGGGGSLIAIPLLVYIVGIPVQHATAMSLVVVGYSALFGAWSENRYGNVKGLIAFLFSGTGMMGAWLGAQGHRLVQEDVILLIFGLLLVSISFWLMWPGNHGHQKNASAECAQHCSVSCAVKAMTIGMGVGLLTGFFGIGGGFVIVPVLMFVMGFPVRMAVGTSLLIIALISIGGIIGHLDRSHLDIQLTGFVIAGSLLGMLVGTRVAQKMKEKTLRSNFAMLVGLTGVFLIMDNGLRLLNQ
ncbi:MAG: sulfite exporter TauE/SafE family protein [Nitrospirales bacterium]|nr:sulfite exporter TauE/SafE family protein [Nitrospira sp.]MDR4501003.1 sulfite exporter TauE/SafE family protein [Nitrospirales bacterium]